MRCCRIFLIQILITLVFSFPQFLQAAEGDLDPTFDGDGKVTTDFGIDERAYAVDIQSDGKIVAAGTKGSNFVDCVLARYNSDGSLDLGFDGDGKVITDFGGNDLCYAMRIQSDAKIIIAGTNYADFILARYNTDGSLDSSFDGDGMVTVDFGGTFDIANDLAIQTDGKIVVAGTAVTGGTIYDFAIARLNSDGSLDNTFNGDGTATTDFGFDDFIAAVAIQPDNKIVAAGSSAEDADTSRFVLARYNPNGTLDNSFDGDGKMTITFSDNLDSCTTVAIQADSKIVIGGRVKTNNYDFTLARINPNGTLDSSFDNDGIVTTDFAGDEDSLAGVKIQPDGRILAAGTAVIGFAPDFALARYNIDGSLDNSFGLNGKVTTDFAGDSTGSDIVLQADGKIIVAGGVNTVDFAIARYQTIECIYCDNFEDNVLDPNWNYIKPSWSEINGSLIGAPIKRGAIAVADPIFAGCQICSVETSINSAGGPSNKIRMLGWYVDSNNMMELQIKEESDKIVLKQIVGGSVVSKNKAKIPIDPNIFYSINVAFDGTKFNVSVNGLPLFSLTPTPPVPPGTVGFQVKNTTGRFGYIAVR